MSDILYRHYQRLGVALIRCMEQLKSGGSEIGLFYGTIEEIEGLMQTCAYCEDSEAAIEEPLSRMHQAANNQDAAALSDVLETQVYPIVKHWLEGTQQT
jgi:hypothetical protein